MFDPYSEGRKCSNSPTICYDNPYPPGSVEWNLWEDGYEDASGIENSEHMSTQELEEFYDSVKDLLDDD